MSQKTCLCCVQVIHDPLENLLLLPEVSIKPARSSIFIRKVFSELFKNISRWALRRFRFAYHLMILVRCTVLFSKSMSIPTLLKNSLAALLSSVSTPWGEKNLTVGLDFVPSHSPKWINGFTLPNVSWNYSYKFNYIIRLILGTS